MLEMIRTFFGRIVGLHENKRTVVVEGQLWRCTSCNMIFITKSAGEQHKCQDQKVS
jgi:hypothetical protein